MNLLSKSTIFLFNVAEVYMICKMTYKYCKCVLKHVFLFSFQLLPLGVAIVTHQYL